MTTVAVHHEVAGPADAPVVVLSPSLGTTLGVWDAQLPALSERTRVVRYDHRGHGKSLVPPGPYSVSDLGSDVLALLDTLGVDRTSFCGVSLGGMVGMWLASHAPDRIARLVLISTSAQLAPPSMWAERAAAVRSDGTDSIADMVVGRWFTPDFVAAHPDRVAEFRAMIADTPDDGYAACCAAIEHMDLRDSLARISAPTIVLAAADDPSTPPEHAYDISARIPGARLEVIPDAAHLVNVQRPDVVNRFLLDHLSP